MLRLLIRCFLSCNIFGGVVIQKYGPRICSLLCALFASHSFLRHLLGIACTQILTPVFFSHTLVMTFYLSKALTLHLISLLVGYFNLFYLSKSRWFAHNVNVV